MGIFDLFKKRKNSVKTDITVFDDELYMYTPSDFEKQKMLFEKLNAMQKSACLVVLGVFGKMFILENTYQREYSDSLINLRSNMLGITYDSALNEIGNIQNIHDILLTIDNKEITDILLYDVKYLFKLLISLTIRYRDGVEINHKAINYMCGIFVPIGYNEKEVYNHNDYLMF